MAIISDKPRDLRNPCSETRRKKQLPVGIFIHFSISDVTPSNCSSTTIVLFIEVMESKSIHILTFSLPFCFQHLSFSFWDHKVTKYKVRGEAFIDPHYIDLGDTKSQATQLRT